MKKSYVTAGLFLLSLAGGCGSSGSSSSGGPVTEETFPARYAKAFCKAQTLCCRDAGGDVPSTCEADVEKAAKSYLKTWLAMDKVEFAETQATTCIDSLESLTRCEDSWETATDACNGLVVGTVKAGEKCESAVQCANPKVGYAGCSELGDGTEKRCRQFEMTADAGEDCVLDYFGGDAGTVVDCQEELTCNSDGKCHETVLIGQACDETSTCTKQGSCYEGKCSLLTLGEACTPNGAPCELQANCVDGTCQQRPLLGLNDEHACSVDP